jgi:hypothetical protein
MRRLVLIGALVAGAFVLGSPANACTIDTCWFTQPVCSRVDCHVCIYGPEGYSRCYP